MNKFRRIVRRDDIGPFKLVGLLVIAGIGAIVSKIVETVSEAA